MGGETGKCVLLLDGERMEAITCALEWNGGSLAFGFLSGPVETLKKARMARRFELELSDGRKMPATMLQVSDGGMALVAINPKHLRNRDKPHE
jgi:hypothetical protein